MGTKKLDIHTHLGDILYGQSIIHKQHQELKQTYYEGYLQERENHFLRESFHYPEDNFDMEPWKKEHPRPENEASADELLGVEEAFTRRNFSASLLEMQKSMERNQITRCAVMAVLPHVSFEDLAAAAALDQRILPFTSIDFSLKQRAGEKLLKDVGLGARGLKIHPVIQKVRLDDSCISDALDRWAQTGLPVLPHLGVAQYYPPDQADCNCPENGEIGPFLELVRKYPDINFIAGHGGNEQWKQLLDCCADLKNVYIDTSMASTHSIRAFLKEWGAERMLFASDWPWLRQEVAVALIEQEVTSEKDKEKIYMKNACKLLNLE